MAEKKLDLGSSGLTVAKNLERLRKKAGLNFTELSTRMSGVERPMSAVSIRRIETEERRVDIDDLVALAVALGVSPITLLMPPSDAGRDEVAVTGVSYPISAMSLWRWLQADLPIQGDDRMPIVFHSAAWPEWWLHQYYEEKRQRDAAYLSARRAEVAAAMDDPDRAKKLAEAFGVDDGDD